MAAYYDSDSDDSDRWDCDDYVVKQRMPNEPRTAEMTTFKTKLSDWHDLLNTRYDGCISSNGQQMLKQEIRACFHDCSCKHQMALYLAENCVQAPLAVGRSRIPTLPCFIFEVLKSQPDITIHEKFDSFIMKRAWKLACLNPATMVSLVTHCFQLTVDAYPWIIDELKLMLRNELYKEVFYCIKVLKIKAITIDMIAFPLICNDNTNLLETYMTGNKGLQTELIKLLDKIIVSEEAIQNAIRNIPNTVLSDIGIKKLQKLALRYMKKYDIPNELCYNILTSKYESTIRYHLHMYYDSKEHSLDEFNDGLEGIMKEMPSCGDYLVDKLIDYLDMDLCAYWAHKLNLKDIPNQIVDKVETLRRSNDHTNIQPTSCMPTATDDQFYKFALPLECIHWIDDEIDFERCMTRLSRPNTRVGIDCEWKPTFVVGQTTRISIMQLALENECVFILDMIQLKKVLSEAQWMRLANDFLCNNQVLKIGFGLKSDMQMITESLPFLNTSLSVIHCVANLDKYSHQIIEHDQAKSKGNEMKCKKGLKGAIEYCLGKPLNKKQQMTNWEMRPLDIKQAIYAALDAYCLIALYDYFKTYVNKEKLNITLVSNNYSCTSEKKNKKKAKLAGKTTKFYSNGNRENVHKISVKSIKFLVDHMLKDLCGHLKLCGIDTESIDQNQSPDCIAEIAQAQERVILAREEEEEAVGEGMSSSYQTLSPLVPSGYCVGVSHASPSEQLRFIVSHFNVNIDAKDVFSRCQACNNNTFLQVSQNEMLEACEKMTNRKKNASKTKNAEIPANKDTSLSEMYSKCNHTRVSMNQDGLIAGKDLQVDINQIPMKVAQKMRQFYVCAKCTKVYWKKTHHA